MHRNPEKKIPVKTGLKTRKEGKQTTREKYLDPLQRG